MVLFTMTPGIIRAVSKAEELAPHEYAKVQRSGEPTLAGAQLGAPVSHSQLINLSRLLKRHAQETSSDEDDCPLPTTLNSLLQSTTLYAPPPVTKPPQTREYHALMAKLRAEQEALSYERMLHPPPTRESFSQRFPRAPAPYSLGSMPHVAADEDEVSYEEVHRQIVLIINVMISIVAVACFIWVAARQWTVGKRLGMSMGGSIAVAIAEVVVYGGYVRKVKEAKRQEKKKPEIKEIVSSWVFDKGQSSETTGIKDAVDDGIRFRKGKHR